MNTIAPVMPRAQSLAAPSAGRPAAPLATQDTFTPSGPSCSPETRDRILHLLGNGAMMDQASEPALICAGGGAVLGAAAGVCVGSVLGLSDAAITTLMVGTGGAVLVAGVAGAIYLIHEGSKMWAQAEELDRQAGCFSPEQWSRLTHGKPPEG